MRLDGNLKALFRVRVVAQFASASHFEQFVSLLSKKAGGCCVGFELETRDGRAVHGALLSANLAW